MQNIINNLAKLNFELVPFYEGGFDNLTEFNIENERNIETIQTIYRKSHNFNPYIIFDLTNDKDEYIYKFLDLLDEFYDHRDTEHSNRLIVEYIFENSRSTTKVIIKPLSCDVSTIENKDIQCNLLKIYQKEFTDFGNFLNNNVITEK